MNNRTKQNHKIYWLILFFLIAVIPLMNCKTSSDSNTDENGTLNKEFKKEGFINNNEFRIVIVVPAESDEDISSIEKTAKHRAFMSFQKFLRSQNRVVKQSIRAKILNLINQHGRLSEDKAQSKTRKVYFFEVKKDNLKHYIYSSSAPR